MSSQSKGRWKWGTFLLGSHAPADESVLLLVTLLPTHRKETAAEMPRESHHPMT